jgi:hypothetical protein
MNTKSRHLLDRQIELLQSGDVDGLVDQYDEEATVLRFDMSAQGHEQIRSLFTDYVARGPRLKSLDSYAESSDMLSYQATMELGGSEVRTYGILVLRRGKIWRQFAGILPPNAP